MPLGASRLNLLDLASSKRAAWLCADRIHASLCLDGVGQQVKPAGPGRQCTRGLCADGVHAYLCAWLCVRVCANGVHAHPRFAGEGWEAEPGRPGWQRARACDRRRGQAAGGVKEDQRVAVCPRCGCCLP